MKRAILLGTMAVFTFHLTVNVRSGAAEMETADSHSLRAIALEVLILGIQGGMADNYATELSGSSENVAARVRQLQSEGQAIVIDRLRLTTLENRKMLVQSGKTAPVATGRSSRGPGGPTQTSYQQQSFGTLLSGTAQIDGDAILVELQIERSELEPTTKSSQDGDEFVPTATGSFTSQTTVSIRSGHTIVVSGLEETAGGKSTARLVLASALLLEAPLEKLAAPERDAKARQVFDKMEKSQLQEQLKKLQTEALVAEQTAKQANELASKAAMVYRSAPDDEKPEALLRKSRPTPHATNPSKASTGSDRTYAPRKRHTFACWSPSKASGRFKCTLSPARAAG